MNVDGIIASLPEKTPAQRAIIRNNAEDKLASGSVAQKQAAQKVLDALDTVERSEDAAHQEWVASASVTERVAQAFTKLPPTETEERLLRVLLDNPGSTSSALTEKLGWSGQAWHMHFGKMCQAREVWLWPAARSVTRDGHFYSGILADFERERALFTMKPEVAVALVNIGLGGKSQPVNR